MRNLFWIPLAGAVWMPGAFAVPVEFRVSRMHGLVNFAETVAGDSHRSRALKEGFDRSAEAPGAKSAIEAFRKARPRLENGWTHQGFPTERASGQTLEKMILIQSAFADSIDELGKRILGYLPPSDHSAYLIALRGLEPVYEKAVWGPSLKSLNQVRDRLVREAAEHDLAGLFSKAVLFYRAQWPADLSFTVALYPIPGAQGHTSAESLGSLESLGVLVDGARGAADFGVLFHELCHSLYESQSPEFQQEWETAFRSSKSNFAEPAYVLINEALATGLGNGWAEEKFGAPRIGRWYDDAYIESFARALYPEVKARIDAGRPLNKEFVAKAISELERTLPEAPFDFALRLKKVVLLVDSRLEVARRELRRRFSVQSMRSSVPLTSGSALSDLKRTRDAVVIVVSKAGVGDLAVVEEALPGLKFPWARLRGRAGPLVFSVLLGDRPVVLIRADTDGQIADGFERVRRAKRIDPKKPLLPELTEPA